MVDFYRSARYAVKIDPTLKYAWINIPKNASSFIQKVLDDNHWITPANDLVDNILAMDSIKKMCVLRDPVDRWISGFAECFCFIDVQNIHELLNLDSFWDTLLKNPVYDDHTEYQHRFVGVATNVKYIYMNSDSGTDPNRFYRDLTEWIRMTGGESNFQHWKERINPSTNNTNKLSINNKIREILKQHPQRKKDITELHQKDYQLLDRLTRYKSHG